MHPKVLAGIALLSLPIVAVPPTAHAAPCAEDGRNSGFPTGYVSVTCRFEATLEVTAQCEYTSVLTNRNEQFVVYSGVALASRDGNHLWIYCWIMNGVEDAGSAGLGLTSRESHTASAVGPWGLQPVEICVAASWIDGPIYNTPQTCL